MLREKLTVSWDDVNSPDVDARLREQEAKSEADANVYFPILADRSLSAEQKKQRIEQKHSNYDTKAFIAKVLAYGLIGMLIALSLSVAEPLIDRNVHGALVNGAVGAMLGLFG